MTDTISRSAFSAEQFKAKFEALQPVILDEWSHLQSEALAATGGQVEQVIDYIAAQTDRTRTLIRQQLAELYGLVEADEQNGQGKAPDSGTQSRESQSHASAFPQLERVENLLGLLESRTENLLKQVERDVMPQLNEKAKENVGTSLLTALGIGFILGLLVGGSGRGRS